jgi:hypothetical protein
MKLILTPIFVLVPLFITGNAALAATPNSTALLGCSSAKTSVELAPRFTAECSDIAALFKSVPVEGTSADAWSFKAEAKTRKEIEALLKQKLTADVIPWGYVQRRDASGNRILVVLDANYIRNEKGKPAHADEPVSARKGYIVMALQSKGAIRTSVEFGQAVKEFNSYNRAHFYFATKSGEFRRVGTRELAGDDFSDTASGDAKKRSLACVPCKGWLCTKKQVTCFGKLKDKPDEPYLYEGEPDGYTLRHYAIEGDTLVDRKEAN